MVHSFCCTIYSFNLEPMKKTLVLFTTILLALQMQAQDFVLLDRIKKANAKVTTLKAHVHNHNKRADKIIEKDGTIEYVSPDKFSAVFENDAYLIVNGNRIKGNIGIFHGTFKMRNGPLRSLSRAFLYAFQGRCQDLAEENNFSLQTKTSENFHTVTFTTKKKLLIGIGIKQALLRFGLDDLLIKEIVLIDYRGYIDTYTLVNEKYNEKIEGSKFKI